MTQTYNNKTKEIEENARILLENLGLLIADQPSAMRRLYERCCCCCPDVDENQPRPVQPSLLSSSPPTILSQSSSSSYQSAEQEIRVNKHMGAFSTDEARFFVGGPKHKVVIKFVEPMQDTEKMRLIIDDGVIVYEVKRQSNFRGNTIINVDGMMVDFVWDLECRPAAWFFFRTRVGDGGIGEDSELQWEDMAVSHKLTILGYHLPLPKDCRGPHHMVSS
ncbi:hypothetical protein KSP39_PZI021769 [Platanthera zijinensis]|uniref:Uncharacterized protein n=1 Tax=Platanthera zijinensis TaxID=2320716 RepID=A0AAP0FVV1_9ASPA